VASSRVVRSLLTVAATVVATLTVTAPHASATAPDPAVAGAHTVTTVEYDAGQTLVTDPSDGLTYPEELQGALYVPSGAGPFPVVLLLHGRHDTCSYFVVETVGPPQTCPDTPATQNIRSYRGYAYLGTNLASHGYLVMSAGANAVNSFDSVGDSGAEERSQVIARSLDLLAKWNTTNGPGAVGSLLVGRVDLSRIGLMGHSRGGEGVDHFVGYNRRRTDGPRYSGLQAVFALAPTDFAGEAPSGVHFATLLPLCDGDVFDLEGAAAYDRGRFADPNETHTRAQYTVTGANHNYFNTVWDLDDYSGSDPACDAGNSGSVRLSPGDQRDVGLVLMAAFFRRWVGAETAFDALVKGAEALPASACPGSATTCPTLVRTSYLAPAASRKMLALPGSGTLTQTGFSTYATCTPSTSGTGCPTNPTRSIATQLTLGWSGPASLTATVPATDVSALAALTFRTGVNYGDARNTTAAQDLDVTVKDATGASATVAAAAYTASLREPPGTVDRELTLDGVWLPLTAFPGVDLTQVTSVTLSPRTASGSIELAELAFQS
jgi:dienelactone hydrolase